MAELLIKAVSASNADPDKDRRGCYKRGDVVVAMEDGHEWGRLEGPPDFVVVRLSGVSRAAAEQWCESWDWEYDLTVLSRSVPLDGWRFRVVNLQRRADGTGTPETERIRRAFASWGATLVRRDADGVVLDWRIVDGATSQAFWGADPAVLGISVTEIAYEDITGQHTFTADWSQSTTLGISSRVRRQITERGGEILASVGATATTYRLGRGGVLSAFTQSIRLLRQGFQRRRFRLAEGEVAAALIAGGVVAYPDAATFAARMIDARA